MPNKTSDAANVPGRRAMIATPVDLEHPRNRPSGSTAPKTRCANPPCGKLFPATKRRGRWQEYCSQRCGIQHREQRQPDIHAKAARTNRERKARLAREASDAGISTDAAFDAKVEAYWRKVADPDYYRGIRGAVTLRSALGGL
jgi:hypothetical protein